MSSQFYYNGYILTMEKPLYAEALFVRDGKIVKAGPEPLLRPLCTADTEKVDLQGHALLPSFIDPHSHLAGAASSLLQVSLDGAATFDELEERIKRFLSSNQIAPGEWVQAKGYDHNALREKKHPPRILLDHIAPENPLVLHHQSGHAGVLNSLALERLGIDETTIPPSGGTIGKENGRLTGYLEENAFIGPIQRIPMPSIETLLSAVKSAQQEYARYGITTVQEGMLTESVVGLYQAFLQKEAFFLDVVGYVDGAASESLLKKLSGTAEHSQKHFKIGGCKVFLDGSPQARTAWMETPYVGAEDGYCGYPALSDEVLQERIRFAFQNRLQLLAHCNGDAAAAQFLSAYRKLYTETSNPPDLRPVMIHAQLLRPDQMTALRELRIIPSFFIAHIFH